MFCSAPRTRFSYLVVAGALAILAACSKTRQPGAERVAVLPFENQTSDPNLNWMSEALANMVAARSAGSSAWQAFYSPTLRDAQMAGATSVVQGYLTPEGGLVRAYATVRREADRKNSKSLSATSNPSSVIELSGSLARQLSATVRAYTTTNAIAVRELFSGRPAAAIAADAQYGLAHLENLATIARAGDPAALKSAMETAHSARLTEAERSRLNVYSAQVSGDSKSRLEALLQLAETTPADPQLWTGIAELQLVARNYKGAADAYGRVLELQPDSQAILNSRGYALMYAGDFDGAVRAIEEYRRLAPELANPIDSLAEVHFYYGRYEDAARLFLEAHAKDPRALAGFEPFRAALAVFMAGKTAKADEEMARLLDARKRSGDQFTDLRQALWLRMTGRKTSIPARNSIEQSTASLFALLDGDREIARTLAQQGRAAAKQQNEVALASTVLLLSEPAATPEARRKRIEAVLPRPEQQQARRQLLGLALLLDRQFAEAAKVWREIYEAAPGLETQDARVALAWALGGAGDEAGARRVLGNHMVPPQVLDANPNVILHVKGVSLLRGGV